MLEGGGGGGGGTISRMVYKISRGWEHEGRGGNNECGGGGEGGQVCIRANFTKKRKSQCESDMAEKRIARGRDRVINDRYGEKTKLRRGRGRVN